MKRNLLRISVFACVVALCGAAVSALTGGGKANSPSRADNLLVLDKAPVTATFGFHDGTVGQKAEFTQPDYFLSGKVSNGSNLILEGQDNKNNNQTWFNVKSKQTKASDDNLIRFIIQPKHGLAFTPSKVSFNATRYGTGGGSMDIAWLNPDGSRVELASAQKPPRDNENPNVQTFSYDVTSATPAEGGCGLVINLYNLDPGKHVGFSDIIIEGTVSGEEKEVPILESFTVGGKTYVADDVFEADGSGWAMTIEMAAAETMISASNPITEAKALKGTIGEITYSGDDSKCDVTIPVSLGEVTVNYIVHFVRKPFFTITYFDTDFSEMGSQEVEKDASIGTFAYDYKKGKVDEGYKSCGWFLSPTGGAKMSEQTPITESVNLYAKALEIETANNSRTYTYDLCDVNFDAEDHEAFSPQAGKWHDKQHGWTFGNGDKINILVGPKATISVGACKYSAEGATIELSEDGNTAIASLPLRSENDGEVSSYNYEGKGGILTLTVKSEGAVYMHNFKIVNTAVPAYTKAGQWYFVEPGDMHSLLDVLDIVNATNASQNAERVYVYIPDGTYDLRDRALTAVTGYNISLIGQSMEGTVIKNKLHHSLEGIGTTATILNKSTGLYMQDLTLKNDLDYYATISGKQVGGRAVALEDKGTKTVCKNVTLLSYQDTYYTHNDDGLFYWETSDIHGTVDFICGGGTLYMHKSTITVEKRNANGSGECTLTAPSTKTGNRYGYVFNECFIDNKAEKYNYGRAWNGEPRAAYISCRLSDDKLNTSRWTAGGMNVPAKEFVEYNTMNTEGAVVSPSSKVIEFTKGDKKNKIETILTAEQAAEFAVEKVFTSWRPEQLAMQVVAPNAVLENGVISWNAVEGAKAYAVFCNGELLEIVTEGTSCTVPSDAPASAVYTIRSANAMGGLGAPSTVGDKSGIGSIGADGAEVVEEAYYNMQGIRVDAAFQGVVIKVSTLSDGRKVTEKIVNR